MNKDKLISWLKVIIRFVLMFSLIYVIGSFIGLSFNPHKWEVNLRWVVGLLSFITSIVILIVSAEEELL